MAQVAIKCNKCNSDLPLVQILLQILLMCSSHVGDTDFHRRRSSSRDPPWWLPRRSQTPSLATRLFPRIR